MAYQYCYKALESDPTTTAAAAAKSIQAGLNDQVKADLSTFQLADSSYGDVCTLLVSWYIQDIYTPLHQDEGNKFDPMDKNQVELSSPVGGK